jgi:hypothetical protein
LRAIKPNFTVALVETFFAAAAFTSGAQSSSSSSSSCFWSLTSATVGILYRITSTRRTATSSPWSAACEYHRSATMSSNKHPWPCSKKYPGRLSAIAVLDAKLPAAEGAEANFVSPALAGRLWTSTSL